MPTEEKNIGFLKSTANALYRVVTGRERLERDNLVKQQDRISDLAMERVYEKLEGGRGTDLHEILSKIEKKSSSNDNSTAPNFRKSVLAEKIKETNGKGRINVNNLIEGVDAAMVNDLFYNEIDRMSRYASFEQIVEFIPEMQSIVDILSENIVSPDSFSDYSLGFEYNDSDKEKEGTVKNRIKDLIGKYKLEQDLLSTVKDTVKNGDQFQAVLPYNLEVSRLLSESADFQSDNLLSEQMENFVVNSSNFQMLDETTDLEGTPSAKSLFDEYMDVCCLEGGMNLQEAQALTESSDEEQAKNDKELQAKIDAISGQRTALKADLTKFLGNKIAFNNDWRALIKRSVKDRSKSSKLENSELEARFKNPESIFKQIKDGKDKTASGDIKVSGSVILNLDPSKVVKLTSKDGYCYGYFYIENSALEDFGRTSSMENMGHSVLGSARNIGPETILRKRVKEVKSRLITDIFISQAKDKLDKQFVEDNPEFREVINSFLTDQYNERELISVSFIPSKYVTHFGQINKSDGYGRSIFESVLFACKLYLTSLVSTIMQKLVFSQEQRIFYIESGLEGDMEGSIQSFVRSLKSKQFKSKDLNDLDTSMKFVGAFSDLFVPKVDNARPIEIETIPSRDVSLDNEFLEYLKDMIILGTGIPPELLKTSKEAEFAKTITMRHGRIVRSVISFQRMFENCYKEMLIRLYVNEYPDDLDDFNSDNFEVKLPLPTTLMTNLMSEQIRSITDVQKFVSDSFIDERSDDEELKMQFRRAVNKELLPTLDWQKFETIFAAVKQDVVSVKIAEGDKEEKGGSSW